MKKDTGGAAFPHPGDQRRNPQSGMTLRDYFAGAVSTGYLHAFAHADHLPDPASVAEYAYQVADAMLGERGKDGSP